MLADYHLHTDSSDGTAPYAEYVERAKAAGLDEVGRSDHITFRKAAWSMPPEHIPQYLEETEAAKKESGIQIRTGLEFDYVKEDAEKTALFLDKYGRRLDYVIGSVHFIGGWNLTSWDETWKAKGEEPQKTLETYFGLVGEMADTRLFDIVGHLDVGKRHGYFPKVYEAESFSKAIEAIAKSGMCVEINTSGLRHPCKEMYPAKALLQACHEHDIQITFGSDAHKPADVGAGFSEAERLAREVGYSSTTRFRYRHREQADL